ncbi:MAG: EpsI family protein [Acidobacteriaceae bacterium]|nr:EpsI family protein [Acidobacteriaceae bacterium]
MRKTGTYIVAIGMLSAALGLGTWSDRRPVESLHRSLEQIPAQLGPWHVVAQLPLSAGAEKQLKASSYISREYSDGRTTLSLFIAYYAVQRAGESMHSPKHCLPGAGWDISQHETVKLPLNSAIVPINRYEIQKGSEHATTLYWYQSSDRIVANEYVAKVLLGYDALTKGRTAGSIVRIISGTNEVSEKQLEAFAKLVIPEMQRCLRTS